MKVGNGAIHLNVDVYGPEKGRPVLLLHGFPDSSRLWSKQIGPLTDAGFRLIVPDQRGYGGSDKPSEVDAYGMSCLVSDAVAILDELGVEKATVVGHDWGAAVAWMLATFAPDRVERLVALSVGHPLSSRASRAVGFEQREKSWYMLLFQFEGIAERWLSDNDWENLRAWSGHPDADAVMAALEADGSLTPGLNWYRANLHPRTWVDPAPELPKITVPAMGIWSSEDRFLTEAGMAGSSECVSAPWRYERLEGPGHWMQWEAPDQVNGLLLDFLDD